MNTQAMFGAAVLTEKLLTRKEVAGIFDVDPTTIDRWIAKGFIRAIRPAGQNCSVRIKRSEINKLLQGRKR